MHFLALGKNNFFILELKPSSTEMLQMLSSYWNSVTFLTLLVDLFPSSFILNLDSFIGRGGNYFFFFPKLVDLSKDALENFTAVNWVYERLLESWRRGIWIRFILRGVRDLSSPPKDLSLFPLTIVHFKAFKQSNMRE